jgi:tRNA (cmo5U34)-methyltransferase
MTKHVNEYANAEHALEYLARADRIPHRTEGEAVLLDFVPLSARRLLDIGTGDGRLLGLLLIDRPDAQGVALDFSATMLEAARSRFAGDDRVRLIDHDIENPLPDLGSFDAVVSSFAIHHCSDGRKRTLYREVFDRLEPGGIFCNLEHVASPTVELHDRFLRALSVPDAVDDPSNQLAPVHDQLRWLQEIGFDQVDCYWKWLELALFGGMKPAGRLRTP